MSEGQKLRLVLDLRNVNPYVNNVKFKYEGLKTASDLLEKDDFMATFDLKNGYHHIPIDENFQGYLGFAWTFADGSTKFYVYTVLPFGLSSASYVFTKFTRPLIKKWRAAGIKNIMYLDDGIIIAPTSDTAKQICETIRQDLKGAGVTLNEEKTKLEPTRQIEWLGFCIDTSEMTFRVPDNKIKGLLNLIHKAANNQKASARNIARIAGKIISMGLALGGLSRLFTRHMYSFVEKRANWDQPAPIGYAATGMGAHRGVRSP